MGFLVCPVLLDLADPGFVAIAMERVKSFAQARLTMLGTHALKLFNVFVSHARNEKLRIHPTHLLGPGWPGPLLGGALAPQEWIPARPLCRTKNPALHPPAGHRPAQKHPPAVA